MPSLKVIDVSCNHCGATLQVDEKTRFVTCSYCHSRLAIEHSNSAIFTQVLERIEESTGHMAGNLELLRLQNELEQLDREWMMARESLMVAGRDGQRSEPSVMAGIVTIFFGIVGGGLWTVFASRAGAPSFFAMFGFLFIGLCVFAGINIMGKAGQFDTRRQTYEVRRQSLIREIADEKRRHAAG